MSIKIDWTNPPYNHSGRWFKKFDSIFSPGDKVTWPQFIAECVLFWRTKLIKNHPQIVKGKGWSQPVQKEVRTLNQQTPVICNFFPHPDDEPLVIYAVKKFIRENRVCAIGAYRKNRVETSKNGNEVFNISQAEKDVVLGIQSELDKVLKSREVINSATIVKEKPVGTPSFGAVSVSSKKKGGISSMLESEEKVNNGPN